MKIFLICLAVILVSCNSENIEKKIAVYEIDFCMNNVLSQIIEKEVRCDYYDSNNNCFSFIIKERKDYYELLIETHFLKTYDYSDCFGIFMFKGHRFICEGKNIDELLKKKDNDFIIVKFNEKDNNFHPFTNDKYSFWVYAYFNKNFTLIGESICPGTERPRYKP